jgi:putative DNA primase/helicase
LQAAIEAKGGAALVIIDPIAETRRALRPIADLAARTGASILGITYFTKGSEGRSPIDRVTGSLAFGAAARVVMVAAREQDGGDVKPGKRIFMRVLPAV